VTGAAVTEGTACRHAYCCRRRCRLRAEHPSAPPPPARAAGPPLYRNDTFFCDEAACFSYHTSAAIWPLARQACKRGGGDLVRMDAFDKQVALEAHFGETGVLNSSFYWLGFGRANYSSPYRFVTGDRVPALPSRFPYAHWTWFQPVAANYTYYDCGLAYGQYRYADYAGPGYSTPELQSAANYETAEEFAQRPYGWTAYLCNAQAYDYMCEYPFTAFRWGGAGG
jgi:hypothetical protein